MLAAEELAWEGYAEYGYGLYGPVGLLCCHAVETEAWDSSAAAVAMKVKAAIV